MLVGSSGGCARFGKNIVNMSVHDSGSGRWYAYVDHLALSFVARSGNHPKGGV